MVEAAEVNFLKTMVDFVALEENISPRTVLMGTGLTLDRLDALGNDIDIAQTMAVYDRIAELSTQPGIGFRRPNVNLGDQGLLGAALSMSGTVDDALHNLQQYGDLLNMLVRYEVRQDAGHYLVRTIPKLRPSLAAYQILAEENLAIWKCASLPLANLEYYLEEIWIDYPAPAHGTMYEELFPNAAVLFDQPYFQAVLRDEVATQVLPGSNPAALRKIEELCNDIIERMTPSTTNRVRSYLSDADPTDWTVLQIADALQTTEKTLSRRLKVEGTSARILVSEHRFATARNHLEKQRPIEEAAAQTGYTDVDAFRKAFKRWSGMTVKEFQRQLR